MPVEVVGIKDVLKGLEFIDEDMRQKIRTAIDPLMRGVALKAKGFVPSNTDVLSGWAKASGVPGTFPKYDASVARAGIGYNPGENKTFQNGFKVSNYVKKSARSKALQEYKSNNPFASQQFVAALEPVTKQPKIKDIRGAGRKTQGRLIYKAWAQDSTKVYDAILKAINATAIQFNKSTEIKKAA